MYLGSYVDHLIYLLISVENILCIIKDIEKKNVPENGSDQANNYIE